ncbi:hypothetical protein [Haloferula sp.]|uniref:hypothetical protein n=1 Tax=Haloferula sp. TaxID=2497595 RepID=UPI00329CA52F
MRGVVISLILATSAVAEDCRVLVEGAGCRTRQLAIQRIWEAMLTVSEVEILPRSAAPADNHRYFIVRSEETAPNRKQLIEALGRRAKHYKVKTVEPVTPE